ncbi:MAG: acyl-CoA carboxylase subunit epsilon [Leifsonia sp.]
MAEANELEEVGPSRVSFVTGALSPTQVSAVSAVLGGVLQAESDSVRATPASGQNAWHRSQRMVRTPLNPGFGQWRGFSG